MPIVKLACCAGWLLTLVLSGCGAEGPESRLEDYLARLVRPLNAEPPIPVVDTVVAPPRWTALQLPIEPGAIDGLDFLKLRGCALQETIARRNSSLGRVAPPSQRLLLELRFLREADDCIAYLRLNGETALSTLLAKSAADKQHQLPALIFNATLGNEEYRDLWRTAQPLGNYPNDTSSLVVESLSQIGVGAQRWLAGDFSVDGGEFELLLADVSRGDGGELLSALALQSSYLIAANRVVEERADSGDLCTAGLQPKEAVILRTVVTRFFVGEVQPWSAAINQRAHALLPPIRQLESLLKSVLPAPYEKWRAAREASIDHWSDAPPHHVAALQSLLGSCFSEFQAAQHNNVTPAQPI